MRNVPINIAKNFANAYTIALQPLSPKTSLASFLKHLHSLREYKFDYDISITLSGTVGIFSKL